MEGRYANVDGGAQDADHRLLPIAKAENIDKTRRFTKDQVEVVRSLDHGNFGEVFLAILRIGGQQYRVAKKQLINVPTGDQAKADRLKNRFLYEYELLAHLGSHRNIISSIGLVGEDLSYLMEFVDGKSLLSLLRERVVNLLNGQKAGIASEICAGVEYLHSKGVIHRDLAARNVMVEMNGDVLGTVKIVDYGHARFIGTTEYYRPSKESPVAFAWSAIEGLMNGEWTVQSDVWSVGVTVFELFTNGVQPYAHELNDISKDLVKEFLQKDQRMDLRDPVEFPPEIANILMSTWNKEPNERPGIAALKNSFSKYANDHPALIERPPVDRQVDQH